jgi:hypothetical protein
MSKTVEQIAADCGITGLGEIMLKRILHEAHGGPKLQVEEVVCALCRRIEKLEEAVREYSKLHDGLSDMVEGGRLKGASIPDDYQWLVVTLNALAALNPEK